ncbi:hypothetical protein KM176_07805 [Pseudooceanicola sp. CBS1P-1]|uniref:Uncharacterized protein n=1 Tax=Pseudooceanicola albus TaxID=2692189 RepID=A0A6L7G2G2_9RHOB|nr:MULTISPECIES: hypothetical protein [Pseudooceanicola]MBT9383756.1 hypothetical protein [Pseudooceanicola endophyticus]MXN17610.1 hypothetical protein [Pseudooceanicola albus]
MPALNFFAYLCWGAAVLLAIIAATAPSDAVPLLAVAFASVVSGVLFLAASKVVLLLTEIRDALAPGNALPRAPDQAETEPERPTRTLGEIQQDIERIKRNL